MVKNTKMIVPSQITPWTIKVITLRYLTVWLWLIMVSLSANAVVEPKTFSSEELLDRFQVLTKELRCPKCQNQNLADSNSLIAADLSDEIFQMLEQGKTDQEIIDFLVVRYGEFVMYRPPLKKTTLALWLTPGLLALIGLIIIWFIWRRQRRVAELSSTFKSIDQQRLDTLLGKTAGIEGTTNPLSEIAGLDQSKGSRDADPDMKDHLQ